MTSRTSKIVATAAIGLLALLGSRAALADPIFNTGGTFSVIGTNAPNGFTASGIAVGAPATVIDLGQLTLFQSITPVGGGNEWITWKFETSLGGSIAGDPNANWSMQVSGVPLNGTFAIKHFFLDWGTNGNLVSPTSDNGANLPLETNPLTGSGTVFGKDFFILTTTAGGTGAANTFSGFLSGAGFNPSQLNTFEIGEEIGSVPEPASLTLLGAGVLGLVALRRRRRAS